MQTRWTEYANERIAIELSQWRRNLHKSPELSNQEWNTTNTLRGWLQDIGAEVVTYDSMPGFVAIIRGKSAEEIAVRADMDALPIQDEKDCEYRSQTVGVSHACGHDGHMAILVGLARVLIAIKEQGQLNKTVRLLFQHSEEQVPGGAKSMIEAGALGNAQVIFGAHLWAALEVGKIGIRSGEVMAAVDRFIIEIQGKGGHASMPHQTVDSVLIASQLVQNLQSIVSRNVDPLKSAVVSVGTLHAGGSFNIIADKARLTGTVRSFQSDVRALVCERIKQLVCHTCKAHDASYQLQYIEGYPSVNNDRHHTEIVKQILSNTLHPDITVIDYPPVMGGEDFSYYQKHIPGVYYFIGAGNPSIGVTYPQHHPKFDIDERSLQIGLQSFLSVLEEYDKK